MQVHPAQPTQIALDRSPQLAQLHQQEHEYDVGIADAERAERTADQARFRCGVALCFIRDHELYRARGYNTFTAYLDGESRYSQRHAFRLMAQATGQNLDGDQNLLTPSQLSGVDSTITPGIGSPDLRPPRRKSTFRSQYGRRDGPVANGKILIPDAFADLASTIAVAQLASQRPRRQQNAGLWPIVASDLDDLLRVAHHLHKVLTGAIPSWAELP